MRFASLSRRAILGCSVGAILLSLGWVTRAHGQDDQRVLGRERRLTPLRLVPKAVRPVADAQQPPASNPAAVADPDQLPPDPGGTSRIIPQLPYDPGYAYPPPFYGFDPYYPVAPYRHGSRDLSRFHRGTAFDASRQTERYRQDALEARRAVEARRRQRRETGKDNVVERPGPYPYNPGPVDDPYGYGQYAQPYHGGYGQGGYGRGSYIEPYGPSPYYAGSRLESYRTEALAAREELTLMAYEDVLTQGVKAFRAGQYGAAARSFMAAAEKHHADAGSRIHAGQALVAVGLYDEALQHVRRAVSLKPLVLYQPINLQADYGVKEDFNEHVAVLAAFCEKNPDDTDAWLLLAYVRFFSPNPELAREPLLHIQKIVPYDRFAERLTRAARPIIAGAQKTQ